MEIIPQLPATTAKPDALGPEATPSPGPASATKHSRKRIALAIAVAAVSDALAFFVVVLPPLQWALDIVTAALLFLILGRRWAILPGLVSEAIPGLALFPAWILVVGSIILYDDIKKIPIKL
jgi:hypothetical protein